MQDNNKKIAKRCCFLHKVTSDFTFLYSPPYEGGSHLASYTLELLRKAPIADRLKNTCSLKSAQMLC